MDENAWCWLTLACHVWYDSVADHEVVDDGSQLWLSVGDMVRNDWSWVTIVETLLELWQGLILIDHGNVWSWFNLVSSRGWQFRTGYTKQTMYCKSLNQRIPINAPIWRNVTHDNSVNLDVLTSKNPKSVKAMGSAGSAGHHLVVAYPDGQLQALTYGCGLASWRAAPKGWPSQEIQPGHQWTHRVNPRRWLVDEPFTYDWRFFKIVDPQKMVGLLLFWWFSC